VLSGIELELQQQQTFSNVRDNTTAYICWTERLVANP
jgi:hypothetical protein